MYLQTSEKLWQVLNDIAADEQLKLYDAQRYPGPGIRIFVDKEHAPRWVRDARSQSDEAAPDAGVTSDDCTRLCRRLRVFFAAQGPQYGCHEELAIEVSSPGINRHLRLPEHYRDAVGQRVRITLQQRPGVSEGKGRETIVGTLSEALGDGFSLSVEGSEEIREIRLADVEKARVDFVF